MDKDESSTNKDKFENPTPKKGEKQKDFINRCIPIVHKEHPDWGMDKVKRVCYEIWRDKHRNSLEMEGYERFTSDVKYEFIKINNEQTLKNEEKPINNDETINGTHMIAVIGDRFMNGGYLSADVLKKSYKQWENTLHDLNHMGTSTGFFLVQQDISYFVGWHTNVKYNEDNKSVSMELNIDKNVPKSIEWEGYVSLCRKAGQIPNVSVTYFGKRDYISMSNLEPDVQKKAKAEGYGKDDLVPVLNTILPVCISTVFKGRCDDKAGCGIRNTDSKCGSNTCECDSCKIQDTKKHEEQIKRIKEKEQKLKSED